VAIAGLDEDALSQFVRHLARRRSRNLDRDPMPFRVQKFLRHLRESGVVTSRAPGPHRSAMVLECVAWMREHRGLAKGTVASTVRVAQAFVDALGEAPVRWDATSVRQFVLGYVRQHAPSSAGVVTSALRCFLRYLGMQGRCTLALVDAVPKVPTWRLGRLPRYLPKEDVVRILAACKRQDGTGLRNRALLLLLARLGLRSHEVVGLRLGDIDWQEGRLRVRGKGRRETRLPLPQEVGDAILQYLKEGRPFAASEHIFLTSRAPIRALTTIGVSSVVARAIMQAGVQAPSRGAHVLRHSLATRLLCEGAGLDAIGAVLRHRDIDTTALYAKVDVNLLRQVAQPWPGESSPC